MTLWHTLGHTGRKGESVRGSSLAHTLPLTRQGLIRGVGRGPAQLPTENGSGQRMVQEDNGS